MTLRVGFFSLDHMHATAYLEAVRTLPGATIAGIWHPDRKPGKSAARSFQTRWFPHGEDLLDAGIDAAVVCSANRCHDQDTRILAAAQIPTLCEKPLGATTREAAAIVKRFQKHRTLLMTAFPCRFSPIARRARTLVQSGEIGKVLSVTTTNRGTFPGGWFVDRRRSGGGALLDHTVHVADLLRWTLQREVNTVFAESSSRIHGESVEDSGLVMMKFRGGAVATLDTSWSRPGSRYPTWGDVTLEFVGEKGCLQADLFAQHSSLFSTRHPQPMQLPHGEDINVQMVREFLAAVRQGANSPVSGVDGLRAVEIAMAAMESARTHEVTKLQPVSLA